MRFFLCWAKDHLAITIPVSMVAVIGAGFKMILMLRVWMLRKRLGDWVESQKRPHTPWTIRRHDLDRAFPHQWRPVRNRLWREIGTLQGAIYDAVTDSYTIVKIDMGDQPMVGPPGPPWRR